MKEEVEKAIEEVKPYLKADGGDIEIVAVEGDTVKVRLKGACAGCPMSRMTLQWGVERFIKKRVPEVKHVIAV